MKYQQPAGEAADASYVDGNKAGGVRGSIPPAAAIEHPQREIVAVINFVGRTPDADDLTQLRKSIDDMIDLKIGGAPADTYLTLAQLAARNPVFPEIQTADGKMNVTSPGAGTILVPSAVNFQHRGCSPYLTTDYDEATERTFATSANKTYHLRWNPNDGFALKDLADSGYNPSAKAETAEDFDTTYDDMLIARVITDPSNIASIVNLVNLPRLEADMNVNGAASVAVDSASYQGEFYLNWSRTPKLHLSGHILTGSTTQLASGSVFVNRITRNELNRIRVRATVDMDIDKQPAAATGYINLFAVR